MSSRSRLGGTSAQPAATRGLQYAPCDSKPFNMRITAEEVRNFLDYDPKSGVFRWKNPLKPGRTPIGSIAGRTTEYGYRVIGVKGEQFLAHRLAWLHFHGTWPEQFIDHIDGRRSNNAIANLRDATLLQNKQNVRAKGYYFDARRGNFRASITWNGKFIHLGVFLSADQARSAYVEASKKYCGEFSAAHREAIHEKA